jgi:hypothetical protein
MMPASFTHKHYVLENSRELFRGDTIQFLTYTNFLL